MRLRGAGIVVLKQIFSPFTDASFTMLTCGKKILGPVLRKLASKPDNCPGGLVLTSSRTTN